MESGVLKSVSLKIEEIYVTAALRKELDAKNAELVAEKILEESAIEPIHVRHGKGRYVLLKVVHRLEALKSLGEKYIDAFIINARQH